MKIRAEHDSEDGLTVLVGEYRLRLDCEEESSPHARPSPVELLVASLAACMASSGRRFLHRAGLDETVSVECAFQMSEAYPDHIASIFFTVTVPSEIPTGRREALMRVLNHCAVHDPLHLVPKVEVAVQEWRTGDRGTPRARGGHTRIVGSRT